MKGICHMLKKNSYDQYYCSALTAPKTCGVQCPFYKEEEEQIAIEKECFWRLKKYHPEYAKDYKSCVTGEPYWR